MRRRPTPDRPGQRYAFAAAAVALFGLVSMHGWGVHAGPSYPAPLQAVEVSSVSASHGDVTAHSSPVRMVGPPMGIVDRPVMDGHRGARLSHDPAGGADHHGGSAGVMAMCLGILVGLVLGVLLMVRRPVLALAALLPTWQLPVLLARDRDPPDLHRLCVIRC